MGEHIFIMLLRGEFAFYFPVRALFLADSRVGEISIKLGGSIFWRTFFCLVGFIAGQGYFQQGTSWKGIANASF